MLKMIVSLLKALSNETSPWQLAFAVSFAMLFSLLPFFTLLSILILLMLLSFRINLGMFLLSTAFFKIFFVLIDPMLNQLGEHVLMASLFTPIFDAAFNNDILRLFHFNNTLAMGAMVAGVVLFIPVLLLSKWLVVRYRVHLLTRINKLHIVQLLKASSAMRWFMK